MHPSSIENMKRAMRVIDWFEGDLVLDVGGRKHSYNDLFVGTDYFIADIKPGEGVTNLMPGPYTLPFHADIFDIVVSGQMLEHCENPFRSVREMARVLKPGGWIILIAPSAGPRHDDPDCWRFMDDAFAGIAMEANLEVVADWVDRSQKDQRSRQWQDHVFVGRKPETSN